MNTIIQRGKSAKRGQITIYLLIGIVLLIVFASIFFFVNQAKRDEFRDSDKEATLSESLKMTQLQNALTQCLQSASEDAVFLVGLQSGYIFKTQGGLDEPQNGVWFDHTNQIFTVPFGIIQGSAQVPPPEYPRRYGDDGYRYSLATLQSEFDRTHLWGQRILPKLCEYKGLNSPRTRSCDASTYGDYNTTIQYKLIQTVEKQVISCLNREADFLTLLAGEIDINATKVDLLLTDSDMRFSLLLNATTQRGGRTNSIEDVTHVLPVRLLRVYNLMFYLMEADITDVLFDKQTDYANITRCNYAQTVQCWDADMRISIIRNPQPEAHPGADIILIEDQKSIIKGQPFTFASAVENRPPMLEYIRADSTELAVDKELNPTERILLQPMAYDPDEDQLRMKYIGWKQNGFENSPEYVLGVNCNDKQEWCGSYNVTKLQPDVKIMQPTVYDSHNASDFQPYKIRIGDKADDDGVFCPANPGLNVGSCNPLQAQCICTAGSYCVWSAPKPIICEPGSVCCQVLTESTGDATSNTMTCEGAECYQSSKNAPLTQNCENGAECNQFTNAGTQTQICTGSNCWQDTKKGAATQNCTKSFCLQESDAGTLTTTCTAPSTREINDQASTLRICTPPPAPSPQPATS